MMRQSKDSGYNSMDMVRALSQSSHKHYSGGPSPTATGPLSPPLPRTKSSKSVRRKSAASPFRTRDGRHQIPLDVADITAERLKVRATNNYVDLHQFAIEQDISVESLEELVYAYAKADFPRVIIDVDAKSFLCNDVFAHNVKTTIRNAVVGTGAGVCDLTAVIGGHMPPEIIVALAPSATEGMVGGVHVAGDHVIWAQSCSASTPGDQAQMEAMAQQIADIVERISEEGFCILPDPIGSDGGPGFNNDLEEAAILAFIRANPHDARPQVVYTIPYHAVSEEPVPAKAKVLVKPRVLKEELEIMQLAAIHRTELMWRDDSASEEPYDIVRQLEPEDFHASHNDELYQILLCSAYIEDLENAVLERTKELEQHRYDEFTSLIETRLWCPLLLYGAGIIQVKDRILRQDLGYCALARFRQVHIPEIVEAIKQYSVLPDEQRASAIDHLESTSQNVQSFAELQSAVTELGRDLQIEPPHENLVLQVKQRSLERTVEEIKDMARGLEILQNLIWVLLARRGSGLFVGSVKYTRKMIQQYVIAGGDPEISRLLCLWWDKVRDGLFDVDDLRQMKDLATDAVMMWREEEQ